MANEQEFREFVDGRWQDGVPPTPNEVAEIIQLAVDETAIVLLGHMPTGPHRGAMYRKIETEMLRRLEANNGE